MMKWIYLDLAIVGAAAPMIFFGFHFHEQGWALGPFAHQVFANPAASGFTVDLLLSSLTFWVWIFTRWKLGGVAPWPFIVLNLFIGLSCALPAYLYWLERRRDRVNQTPAADGRSRSAANQL